MNNKGFAFSTMLYGFMIIGCLIFLIILGLMSTNRTNTREMINLIEDDSRIVEANKTYTKNETGKDYVEHVVPLGSSGWYKIELWGNKKYSAKTIYLQELTKIKFFIGSASTETYACSSNVWSGDGPDADGYLTDGDADNAIESHEKQIETISDCTSGNAALIISTAGNNTSIIKQIADERGKNGSKVTIITYPIDNSKAINYYNGISTDLFKVRISFVSNAASSYTFGSSNGCVVRHSGIYYIKSGTNFMTYNSDSYSNTKFTGGRDQKWLVECITSTSSCKARSLANLAYEINYTCNNSNLIPAGY